MTPTAGGPADTTKLPYRILALDDDENALAGMLELMRESGYHATGAPTYDTAKRLLEIGPYDLLVADVRLRGFNGLNLIRYSHLHYPDMALMIITGYEEPNIELEAGRYGAEYMLKPIRPAAFLESVGRALAKVRRQRRWPRKRVLGGFRVTAAGRTAAVVDVSYGGLRLEIPASDRLPSSFDVEVAGIGLQLQVEPVWWQASEAAGSVMCGAALSSDSTPAARTWRAIVDRLSA